MTWQRTLDVLKHLNLETGLQSRFEIQMAHFDQSQSKIKLRIIELSIQKRLTYVTSETILYK